MYVLYKLINIASSNNPSSPHHKVEGISLFGSFAGGGGSHAAGSSDGGMRVMVGAGQEVGELINYLINSKGNC